jgi:predicted nuclease of predicted toxin-antitoxin system
VPCETVRLLIDEDVWQGLAAALREAGYDAISATESGYKGMADEEILAEASQAGRALLSHNIQDFAPLAEHCYFEGIPHAGIILARQFGKGELLRRTLALLKAVCRDDLENTLRFI